MTDVIGNTFANTASKLASTLRENWVWPSAESGFGWHVLRSPSETDGVPSVEDATWPANPLHQAPALAAAGYLLSARKSQIGAAQRKAWAAGLDRLGQKDAFPADRQSFVHRPVELLGIALGISECTEVPPETRHWFGGVIQRLAKEAMVDVWEKAILCVSGSSVGVDVRGIPGVRLDELAADELALLRWCAHRDPAVPSLALNQAELATLDSVFLKRLALEPLPAPDVARAAVLLSSMRGAVNERIESAIAETWQVGRHSQDAEKVVENLCRRFHLFAMQIRQRHDGRSTVLMSDEYDVQDAMHALLRLHFADVRAEEVSPSYAGKSTRMDFLLKREKIVVETKMTRRNLDQNGIVNELIEDKERYRTHPDFRTLICLVYDPSHICKNPTALEDDVSGQQGDLKCIVVVNPKGM